MKYSSIKILLINPPVINVIEPWTDQPEYVRTALAHLAGYLREYSNVEIQVIDAKYEQITFEIVVERAKRFNPDIVGLTAFTSEIKPAAYQAALIKKSIQKALTVIGGVHVTTLPKETLEEFPFFDIGVVGEGEITLKELVEYKRGHKPLHDIKGLVFRNGNEILQTSPRPNIIDQEGLPMPAWDLLPKAKMYYIQTEKGCPFNCQFCVNHNGRVARKQSPKKVIKEFEYLIQFANPDFINIGDEIFTVDMPRAYQIMEGMIEKGIHKKIKWDVQTHVKYIDEPLMEQFKRANIYELHMGVEAGDEISLKNLGKGNTKETILKAFDLARKVRVKTGAFFILGHPGETISTMTNTINFAAVVNPDVPMFSIMVAYPGTEIARLASRKEQGFAGISKNWDDYRFRIGGSIWYQNFSKQQLEWMLIKGYLTVFVKNFRFLEFVKFGWKYRTAAFTLLKKVLTGKEVISDYATPPKDYEKILKTDFSATDQAMEDSKSVFSNFLGEEMKRTKKSNPSLVSEQKFRRSDQV